MKKVKHSSRREFKMPKLFIDDIEKIFAILTVGKSDVVTISDGEYEYHNPSEINADGRTINMLEVTLNDPYIRLTLSNHDATIYISDADDAAGFGLMTQVAEVVKARERQLRYNLSRTFIYFVLLSIINVIYYVSPLSDMSFSETHFIPEAVGLTIIILYTYLFQEHRLRSFSTIVFSRSSEQRSFWQRNSDQLIVAAFSSVSGVLATLLVQYFLP